MPTDPTALATTLAADLVALDNAGRVPSWDAMRGRLMWASALRDDGPALLDLTDGITVQALLLLVREASRKPHITVMVSTDEEGDPDFAVWSVRVPARYGTHSMASGPTEAAALCTALHALADEVRRG